MTSLKDDFHSHPASARGLAFSMKPQNHFMKNKPLKRLHG